MKKKRAPSVLQAALVFALLPLTPLCIARAEDAHQSPDTAAAEKASCPQRTSCPIGPLTELITGNQRFTEDKPQHPLQDTQRREKLRGGQKPQAIILSCSDSRVPPELIFDKGLGELFVVRTAGQVADPVAIVSIEYAVEHLNVPLLVVLGHDSCGAVKATIDTKEGASAGSESLDRLLALIRPNIAGVAGAEDDKTLRSFVRANVDGVAKALISRSKIIKEKIEHKELLLVKGVYHFDTGKVEITF